MKAQAVLIFALSVLVSSCADTGGATTSTSMAPSAPPSTTTSSTTASTTSSTLATTSTVETSSTTTSPPDTTTTTEAVIEIRRSVVGREVEGGDDRVKVQSGLVVRIVVEADVADHVHLHGYDLMADVRPGAPAVLEFVADLRGIFEVELEDARLPLFDLQVE